MLCVFILFNFVVPLMAQSFEKTMHDRESLVYQNKALLVERATNAFVKFGCIKSPFDMQTSLIVRKKKFSDDVGERLDKHKWQGSTKAIKDYLQFHVISRIEEVESQTEQMQRQLTRQVQSLQQEMAGLSRQMSSLVSLHGQKPKPAYETSQLKSQQEGMSQKSHNYTVNQFQVM